MNILKFLQSPDEVSYTMVPRVFLLLFTAAAITLTMNPILAEFMEPISYLQGEIANRSIRAPRDFFVEDTLSTDKRRVEAAGAVKPVFVFNDSEESGVAVQLKTLFQTLREYQSKDSPDNEALVLAADERANFERHFGVDFVGDEWEVLGKLDSWPEIEQRVTGLVQPIRERGIVATRRVLSNLTKDKGGIVRRKSTAEERTFSSGAEFYDLHEAAQVLDANFPSRGYGRGGAFGSVVRKLADLYIRPNIVFDSVETERRMKAAGERIDPIYYQVKRGEMVVRAGDKITLSQQMKLGRLQELNSLVVRLRAVLSYMVVTLLVLVVAYSFTQIVWRNFRPSNRDLSLISINVIGTFALLQIFTILGRSLSISFPDLTAECIVLAAPIAMGGIILQVTLGTPSVFLFVLSSTLLTDVFMEFSWELLLLVFLGNVIGVLSVKKWSRRADFLRAGLRIATVNVLVVGCFLFVQTELGVTSSAVRILCALIGGVTSGVFAAGCVPFAEHFGSYVTDIKLLELSSLDHPLLRELSIQAPGTWNHSMVMGQMGEAAAEAIGANCLLTRVGAYYHDVGKTKKPGYFVENQMSKDNRHDKLTPSMSALVIRTHVKDGIEMAKKYHIPGAVVDFIPQHHGTALIEFFYEKALKEAEECKKVDESHYRYPGPKPQTKETGILMLADAAEAASRTITDPTLAKIQGAVQKIINKVFASGQLDECELTLKDLHQIAKSFTRVLSGIYHRRVEYSEPAEKTAGSGASAGRQAVSERGVENGAKRTEKGEPRKNDRRSSGEANGVDRAQEASSDKATEGNGPETLKRLGM